jgi:hypothetical protein
MLAPRTRLLGLVVLALATAVVTVASAQPHHAASASAVADGSTEPAGPVLATATAPRSAGRTFVAWGGSYWPAEIIARVDARRVVIHYLGWGDEWDEVVGPDRLRQP